MVDTRTVMDGANRFIEGTMGALEAVRDTVDGAVNTVVQARFDRLSRILYDLQEGNGFEGPREHLSVKAVGASPALGRVISLNEFTIDDVRTETTIAATWGKAGHIMASQTRVVGNKLDWGATYDSEAAFVDNSLHIGGVIRAARVAQRIQRPYALNRSSGYGYVSPTE